MNSKFLKKVVLSCLVLGAVNYGNIGNTMEANTIVAKKNPVNGNYIKVIDTVKVEKKDGKQLQLNHYIGKIGEEQFDIDATKQIELKTVGEEEVILFGTSYKDSRIIKAINIKINTLQSFLNRVIENKLSNILNAYSVFLEYYNKEKGEIYSLKDIVSDTVKNCVEAKQCNVDQKTLKKMVDYYTNVFQKNKSIVENFDFSKVSAPLDFVDREQNANKQMVSTSNFCELLGLIVKHIAGDLKAISQYKIDSSKKLGTNDNIMPHEFYEPKDKIDQEEMADRFRKDVLGNVREGEKIDYNKCSRLVQYIIKYMPDNIFSKDYGTDYLTVIVNDDIKNFRYTLDALKSFASVLNKKKQSGFVDALKKFIAGKVNNSIDDYIKKQNEYIKKKKAYENAMKEIDDYNTKYETNKDYYSNASEESAYISNVKQYDMKKLDLNNINDFNIDENNIFDEEFGHEEETIVAQKAEKKEDPLDDLNGDNFNNDNNINIIKKGKEEVEDSIEEQEEVEDSIEEKDEKKEDPLNNLNGDNFNNGNNINTIKEGKDKGEDSIEEQEEVEDSIEEKDEKKEDPLNNLNGDNFNNGNNINTINDEDKKDKNIKEQTKETKKNLMLGEDASDNSDYDDEDFEKIVNETKFIDEDINKKAK